MGGYFPKEGTKANAVLRDPFVNTLIFWYIIAYYFETNSCCIWSFTDDEDQAFVKGDMDNADLDNDTKALEDSYEPFKAILG